MPAGGAAARGANPEHLIFSQSTSPSGTAAPAGRYHRPDR